MRTSRFTPITGLVLALLAAAATTAHALVEEVLLTHAGTDDAMIERASGERWWLDVRQDCFGIREFLGRTLLVWSPTGAITTRSRLLIPERDLSCPIWQADTLSRAARPRYAQDPPGAGIRALRQSLEMLGYDCGPPSPGWTPQAALAFQRFRETRRLDTSPQGLRRAVASLALDVMRGRQVTGTALRLSRTLSEHSDLLVGYLSRAGSGTSACGEPTFVRDVAPDGALVTLGDGTRWHPVAEAGPVVARWQSGDQALACSGRLVNGRTGEMVRAMRLN